MNNLLRIACCFFCLIFEGVIGMHLEDQALYRDLQHFSSPAIMETVAMHGGVFTVPVLETPMLYLVTKQGVEAFNVPEGVDIHDLISLLHKSEFPRSNSEQMEKSVSKTSNGVLDYKSAVSTLAVELPKGMRSAMDYFTGSSVKMPEDEESLFFLRSLLSLRKVDSILIDNVEDKLLKYDSYYKEDPYIESARRLHDIGIYEYKKMFTEKSFVDLQIVMELSKLTKDQNAECKADFEIFLHVLKVIVETFKDDDANGLLLQKFKDLYERMVVE